jgi:hypothetical protein
MGLKETTERSDPLKVRRVFADSWFASVETALALREEMGVDFTGSVETTTREFPIEAMRWTLATMARGEHLVLKSMDYENLWVIGRQDVHYKCYVTTSGLTTPGKPAPKKRRNREGTNYHIPIAVRMAPNP